MNLKRPRHRGGSLCSPKHPTSPTSILKRQPGESWDFWIIYTSCEGCLKHVQGKKNRKPKVLSAFRFNDSHSATLAFAKGKSGTSSSKKTSKRMMGFLSLGRQKGSKTGVQVWPKSPNLSDSALIETESRRYRMCMSTFVYVCVMSCIARMHVIAISACDCASCAWLHVDL